MRDQPSPRRHDPDRAAVASVLVMTALAGCSAPPNGVPAATRSASATPSATPGAASATAVAASSAGEQRPALPAGFPVMPGATPASPSGDASLIARWTVDKVGSAAYDFYVCALPAAGFTIVGLYPAERSALIRFNAPAGGAWQVVAEQAGSATQITVRTDRP